MKNVQTIRIEPRKGIGIVGWTELCRYRDLFYFLIWRDLKVRYKQTILGVLWAIIPPTATMIVFTFIFGKFIPVPTGGVPYPIFIFSALLPWQLFAHALTESSNSLILNQQLITKVYFPRILIPVSSTISSLVDFCCSFLVFIPLLIYFQITLSASFFLLPLFALLALFAAIGVGLWLSALNAKYRDIRYTLPVLTQIWFFATPITYSISGFPEASQWILSLNPLTGPIEGFRWATFGSGPCPTEMILTSLLISAFFFISGLIYFSKVERTLSDVI